MKFPLHININGSSRHAGTLGKSFTCSCLWRFGVKLRNSIRAVSGAPVSTCGNSL